MTLTDLYEQRRQLQFRYDNSSWQSGPDYRLKMARLDALIAARMKARAQMKQFTLDAIHAVTANFPHATPADIKRGMADAHAEADAEFAKAISEGIEA